MNTIQKMCILGLFGVGTATAQINLSSGISQDSVAFHNRMEGQNEMMLFHNTLADNNKMQSSINFAAGSGKVYHDVLMVGPFPNWGIQHFYVNTKIPFTPQTAPQIHIKGYNYSNPNRAVSLTLGWYFWDGTWWWTQYRSDLGYYNPSRIRLGTYDDAGTTRVRIEIANDGTYWSSYFFSARDHQGQAYYYENWTWHEGAMPSGTGNITTVHEYGFVNIGSPSSPTTLTVAGAIRAREIRVDVNAGADFVFEPDYNLRPLAEVEQFIIENRHLPDIAPARCMVENGVDVGEFQIQLLQKIEELTLYLIEQERRIKILESKLKTK